MDEPFEPRSFLPISTDKIPAWIKQEHPLFVDFMEAYYEWMELRIVTISMEKGGSGVFARGEPAEQNGEVIGRVIKWNSETNALTIGRRERSEITLDPVSGQVSGAQWTPKDIQTRQNPQSIFNELNKLNDAEYLISNFFDFLQYELMPFFPSNIAADKSLTIKNIRHLYRSKGTEAALRMLFRILFDEEIRIQYPYKHLFATSVGDWEKTSFVQTTGTDELFELADRPLTGETGTIEINLSTQTQFNVGETVKEFDKANSEVATFEVLEQTTEELVYTDLNASIRRGFVNGYTLVGQTSGAEATVVSAFRQPLEMTAEGVTVSSGIYRIGVSSVSGIVRPDMVINTADNKSPQITFRPGKMVTSANVTDGGYGNFPGEVITLNNPNGPDGQARISNVTHGQYIEAELLNAVEIPDVSGATGVATKEDGTQFANLTLYDAIPGPGYPTVLLFYDVDSFLTDNNGNYIVDPSDFDYAVDIIIIGNSAVRFKAFKNSIGRTPIRQFEPINGSVRDVEIILPGFGWTSAPSTSLSGGGNVDFQLGALFSRSSYDDQRGQPSSSSSIIQDEKRFQPFSYTVQSSLSIKEWEKLVKKITHPAGIQLNGDISIVFALLQINPNTVSGASVRHIETIVRETLYFFILPGFLGQAAFDYDSVVSGDIDSEPASKYFGGDLVVEAAQPQTRFNVNDPEDFFLFPNQLDDSNRLPGPIEDFAVDLINQNIGNDIVLKVEATSASITTS